nr:cytochrome c oxydase subunit 3 [Physella acuta]CAH2593676.1 cytochrome c oxydase subunit 3 [Physella acuta]CAH2594061.1 cytochrome c oxydase subunit 3 [Physella acuta]CAH2594144.1 cytochrome c oxydase subunit 3 [Physella acuta]CAH2594153.1 cytochrome c oxydase subunit 3 [Physella acuta]
MLRTPFHLVELSPWPFFVALGSMSLPVSFVYMLRTTEIQYLVFSLAVVVVFITMWLRDIVRESTYQGMHTSVVVKGLKVGFLLFIVSEVFFFVGFFWAYFHVSLSPDIALGGVWPGSGIITIKPFSVPLLNTVLLLSSGVSLTWSHHAMMGGDKTEASISLICTIVFGLLFLVCQFLEYYEACYTISDSVFGSVFFMGTGFHGFHVFIGVTMLTVTLLRLRCYHFSSSHHLGFLVTAWYWHFVDVVWLFLFLAFYWWPS